MTISLRRILFLEVRDDLGEQNGPDRFTVHWEFALQLYLLLPSLVEDRPRVSAAKARELARMVESKLDDPMWHLHMTQWGDSDFGCLKAFVDFLRGGEFVVMDLSQPQGELQNFEPNNRGEKS